ncbi:MAG: sigma 54-interacting transcriptional regulator [Planctomycetaceae bacterium]
MRSLRRLISDARVGRAAIIGVIATSGQVVRSAIEGGADVLLVTTTGFYRQSGTGPLASCLPYGNANEQTMTILREQILPRADGMPVVAGLLASDPTKECVARLEELQAVGVAGVVNWPSVGIIDGNYRQALEDADLGLEHEISALQKARDLGLTTFAYVVGVDGARRFAESGVDAMILTAGLTSQGDGIRQRRERLQYSIMTINRMVEAVAQSGKEPAYIALGGAITAPEDLEELIRHCPVHGFASGPGFDGPPIQSTIAATVRRFRSVVGRHGGGADEAGLGQVIGRSAAMRGVFRRVRQIAPHNVNVYLGGESGTGKELVATQIHRLSQRAHGAFVTLNCGAIPESLLESEFFGHEKGAFTGADRRRLGKFELAHQGTLFLDEIADLSPRGQVALLRAIQQREISRVGGDSPVPVDVRIIAASNQNLADLVAQRKFRADLYYRLSYVTVLIPPLRERQDDIPLLVEAMRAELSIQLNRKLTGITQAFAEKLRLHQWPGNVRELQQVIGQAALFETGPILNGDFFERGSGAWPAVSPDKGAVGEQSRRSRQAAARDAVAMAGGNKSHAARALGIARQTLYAWLQDS